jgi:predicted GIY-YIG superfamily endonuclease
MKNRWPFRRLGRGKTKRLNQLLVRLGQKPVKDGCFEDLNLAISWERTLRRLRRKAKAQIAKNQKKEKGGKQHSKRLR